MIRCAGCGAMVPELDDPTHPYIGAAAGCWALFGELLARSYQDLRYAAVRQLLVDTYAAQHPGSPSRKSIQSVAVHLISLNLVLEQNLDPGRAPQAIREALALRDHFCWLEPPSSFGELTILDAAAIQEHQTYLAFVNKWAWSVWEAWTAHHQTVREWISLIHT